MLANNRFFIFTSLFLISSYALGDHRLSLDDKLGKDYVATEDVQETKQQMSTIGYGYGTDWIVMPDGDGSPKIAILRKDSENEIFDISGEERFTDISPVEENVLFQLYTKNSPDHGETINSTNLRSSNFDPRKSTKIVIHGWQSSGQSDTVLSIRDAYLQKSDVNIITVDWSSISKNVFYPTPARNTKNVGKYVANIIDDLVEAKGARYSDFHIIGHSLGAHISGIAGHNTRQKVSRVTGLDPALPLFQDVVEPEFRLDYTDADFVEVIHTCAGALGISAPVGHADFYPNGGSPLQPGCCCLTEITNACSHGRSHKYFAESILMERAFESVGCPTWKSFKGNSCNGDLVPMGEYTPNSTRGTYFLRTNNEPPFGLGVDGITYRP